jgi:hypothetical protein
MTTAAELASYASSFPSFRNRIINGNLSNPINQRGAGSITASTGYTYDRWYYDGSTYLYQGIEDKNVNNGTYVISWEGSGINAAWKVSTDTTAGNGPDATTDFLSVSNGGTFTVNEGTEYSKHLWIRFDGTLANLDKVQVEEGTVATPFEHRPYGTELGLCQRYFCKIITGSGPHAVNGASLVIPHSYPTTMRVSPDLTETIVTSSGNQAAGYPGFNSYGKDGFNCVHAPNTTAGTNLFANYSVIAKAEL